MARDKENERGKIGAEVNEMQRMERLERKKERKKEKEVSRRNRKTPRVTKIVTAKVMVEQRNVHSLLTNDTRIFACERHKVISRD